MKLKTMEKEILRVFNKWTESISDKEVQKKVRQGTILAGGSIASMFLREDVNDWDFYFKDIETAEAVVNYYTKYVDDIVVQADSNDRVKLFIKSSGQWKPKTRPSDNYKLVFASENALTLSGKIQLVMRFVGEPDDILKNYDFAHVTNYWTSWGKNIVTNNDALICLLTKELIYKGSLYPLASILRIRKFINRGWTITAGNILKMVMQVAELDLKNITTLREQLTGVDVSYFKDLIDALQHAKDKNESIDTLYILELIENILD